MSYPLLILVLVLAQDIPFKPKDEFDLKLDYQFRQRPAVDHNTVRLGETVKEYERTSPGVLPYLILHLNFLKLPDDKTRLRIATNLNDRAVMRKVSVDTSFELDMGFTDDMKDRVKAHVYELTLLDKDRRAVDRILISIDEDGSFYVNEELRGRF